LSGYGEKMAAYESALGEVNVAAVEFVQGISVVKTFGQTGRAHRSFTEASHRFVDMFWGWVSSLIRVSSAAEVVLSPLTTLTVIAGAGTWFASNGWISATDLISFFLLGLVLTAPILTLGFAMGDVQIASAAAARVGALLDLAVLAEPKTPQTPDGNRIELESVSFSYDGERTVLDDVSLTLEPGTVTAVVGPSGSGKSTLAKMLCRFWDPTAGSITLGGIDLREISSDELYQRVGFVFQDVQLLGASIGDNIALARPDATRHEIETAARAAQIHERIEQLPGGYDARIGDVQLSGGEAQRVSIARALLADAPVLVLDEATAFADPESEAAIQSALSTLVEGRTLLVIAHRLSTIVGADQIVVVDDGRLAESGTHNELLALDGLYCRQWEADRRGAIGISGPGSVEVIA
ncbi:MAG: ABC transporter ATP-binding protein, partial [Actinomycetota bacterium]